MIYKKNKNLNNVKKKFKYCIINNNWFYYFSNPIKQSDFIYFQFNYERFYLLISKVILVILSFIFIIFYSIDGYDDPHYLRFTTSKKKSLIIGDSRSAFGLRPDILNNELSRNDIYNFLDIHTSPLVRFIMKKLKNF